MRIAQRVVRRHSCIDWEVSQIFFRCFCIYKLATQYAVLFLRSSSSPASKEDRAPEQSLLTDWKFGNIHAAVGLREWEAEEEDAKSGVLRANVAALSRKHLELSGFCWNSVIS